MICLLEIDGAKRKPDFNIGKHYVIARGYYQPDSASFLTWAPIKDNYITAEYRSELLDAMLKLVE